MLNATTCILTSVCLLHTPLELSTTDILLSPESDKTATTATAATSAASTTASAVTNAVADSASMECGDDESLSARSGSASVLQRAESQSASDVAASGKAISTQASDGGVGSDGTVVSPTPATNASLVESPTARDVPLPSDAAAAGASSRSSSSESAKEERVISPTPSSSSGSGRGRPLHSGMDSAVDHHESRVGAEYQVCLGSNLYLCETPFSLSLSLSFFLSLSFVHC